jgi:hypothetical protein
MRRGAFPIDLRHGGLPAGHGPTSMRVPGMVVLCHAPGDFGWRHRPARRPRCHASSYRGATGAGRRAIRRSGESHGFHGLERLPSLRALFHCPKPDAGGYDQDQLPRSREDIQRNVAGRAFLLAKRLFKAPVGSCLRTYEQLHGESFMASGEQGPSSQCICARAKPHLFLIFSERSKEVLLLFR